MEVTASSVLLSIALATCLTFAWKAVIWVWLRPKQLERGLREQGFKGNPYKLLYGDSKELIQVITAARSKPMEANDDDIVARILPTHLYFGDLHGTNYFAWMGPTPRVTITDPKLIKEIFSNVEVFHKSVSNPFFKLLARGLLTYEGEKWATHRSLVNPAFHLEKLKLMVPAMYSSCCEMITKWEVLVSTKGSYELDVWPYLSNLTADVISQTAFGSDYEEGKQIFQLQRIQMDLLRQSFQMLHIPGWRFLPTKTKRKMKKNYNQVRALVRNVIIKRQQTVNEEGNNDLLGILLKSNLEATDQEQGSKNIKLTIEDIIEECKLFYLAGQETTSVLLVWTMVLLSKNQKWQALAREEVLAVFGDNKPNFDGLHQLKTVTMILNEVMRLYPPVAFLTRYIHKNTKLGERVLQAGTEILVPTIAIHHDPEIWGQDSKNFKPERFSEGIMKATKGQATFIPFAGGPRICIGQNFALVEAKIALAMILKCFSFQLSSSYVHAPSLILTLQPQYGVQLTLQKIF